MKKWSICRFVDRLMIPSFHIFSQENSPVLRFAQQVRVLDAKTDIFHILSMIFSYISPEIAIFPVRVLYVPVVPHKAVAEASE